MNLTQALEAASNVLRFRHMSYRTEQAYLHWIKRFAFWCRDHAEGGHEDKVRRYAKRSEAIRGKRVKKKPARKGARA